LDMLHKMQYRGIVIETSAWGLHLYAGICSRAEQADKQRHPVVACSQCLYEASDFRLRGGQETIGLRCHSRAGFDKRRPPSQS
jgi:L-asparaginase/Glu-tRNA(Gln) amidotransferase subunit D